MNRGDSMVMMEKSNSYNLMLGLSKLLSVIYVCAVLSPYFMNNHMSKVVLIAVLWFFTSLFVTHYYEREYVSVIALVFLWFTVEYAYKYIGLSTASIGNYYLKSFFWIPLIMFVFYLNIGLKEHIKVMAKTSMYWLFINILDNIRLQIKYSSVLQYYKNADYAYLLNTNIGDTMFSAITMSFILCCTVCLIMSTDTKSKIKLIIFIVISYAYLLMGGRATAFILSVIGMICILLYVASAFRSKKSILWLGILFIAILIIIYIISNENLLKQIIPNERLLVRILGILGDEGGNADGFTGRLYGMSISWNSFINHPFFGIGFRKSQDLSTAAMVGIGQHCEIIDLLAKYGLFGFIINFVLFYEFIRIMIRDIYDKFLLKQIIIIMGFLLVYSFLNHSMHICTGPLFFIVLPALNLITEKVEYVE